MTPTPETPAAVATVEQPDGSVAVIERPLPTIPRGIPAHIATGAEPLPLILVEGGPKSGRSWAVAEFTGDPRVGDTFWFDFGEGTGDPYVNVPGARPYAVVDHDGTYAQLFQYVDRLWEHADVEYRAKRPPVVLVIDNATDLWTGLQQWTHDRARLSFGNRKKLLDDPNAEIDVSHAFWNPTNARWERLFYRLKTFPGIVVVIADAGWVSEFGADNKPTGNKVYSVSSNKRLPHDARVWLRFQSDGKPPLLVAGRNFHGAGVDPRKDRPRALPVRDNVIGHVIFDVLGHDPATAKPLTMRNLQGGALVGTERVEDPDAIERELRQQITQLQTPEDCTALEDRVRGAVDRGAISRSQSQSLFTMYQAKRAELAAAARKQPAEGGAAAGSEEGVA